MDSKVQDLETQFLENTKLAHPGRCLHSQGQLTKKCKFKDEKYQFFLFTDMLLYASWDEQQGKWKEHQRLVLDSTFEIEDLPDGLEVNRWQIFSSKKTFIVYANSGNDKDQWMKDIRKCQEDLKKLGGSLPSPAVAASFTPAAAVASGASGVVVSSPVQRSAGVASGKRPPTKYNEFRMGGPQWVDKDFRKECQYCQGPFGVFNRKRNCRVCGDVFCSDCTKNKMMLSSYGYTMQEIVCPTCYAAYGATGNVPKYDAPFAAKRGPPPVPVAKAQSARGLPNAGPSSGGPDLLNSIASGFSQLTAGWGGGGATGGRERARSRTPPPRAPPRVGANQPGKVQTKGAVAAQIASLRGGGGGSSRFLPKAPAGKPLKATPPPGPPPPTAVRATPPAGQPPPTAHKAVRKCLKCNIVVQTRFCGNCGSIVT